MKYLVAIILSTLSLTLTFAQRARPSSDVLHFPMEPASWEYEPSNVEFITHRGVKAAKVHNAKGNQIQLKNYSFTSGTIEYDVEFGQGFPGIYFRMSSDKKNGENFYLRYFGASNPFNSTTLQYAPIIDSMSMWDIANEYQAGASLITNGWNHVKLVISGKQMIAFVNDMSKPALVVPQLEGTRESGNIFFAGGEVIFANFSINPKSVDGLNPTPGFLISSNDTRYLRQWKVSKPIDLPYGNEIRMPLSSMTGRPGSSGSSDLPDTTVQWSPIHSEYRDIINLSRVYGRAPRDGRRVAWLKTTIISNRAQERTLSLGFSDEVWVFVNGRLLVVDKNHFGMPGQKLPRGRLSIENASVRIPLREGKNEVMIALANYFYGWALIARLDDMDGIQLE